MITKAQQKSLNELGAIREIREVLERRGLELLSVANSAALGTGFMIGTKGKSDREYRELYGSEFTEAELLLKAGEPYETDRTDV